ncbi:hypothetical protein A3860_19810 [Niastella vici]|uniref:DUF5777 domain-containing protein n=1 Tax=Niastella vici TaxID=1703345 RepID=A0A1V9G183_9BACT|nr:DUF5777 family beta-barrel protein [Niastella vici]OQP64226.1 hypothetical protein A3860_19810 [Niastella vici]
MLTVLHRYATLYRKLIILLLFSAVYSGNNLSAQDSTAAEPVVKKKSYAKNTFEGNYLIDNQTVMVPVKGTFEFDISHRFGTVNNGFTDLFGLFAGANMRLGFSYVPVKDLQVGFGVNNFNMQVDGSLKYALLKQTKDNAMPVSVTYFGNLAMDTRKKNASLPIVTFSDRFTFFNQVLVARKITEALSAQVGFSITHFNNIEGYYDKSNTIQLKMKNDHLAVCFSGRYKITPKTSIVANYDQPITQHAMNNPHPNISLGLQMQTSGHTFQVFAGNYGYTLPQDNNLLNQNDYTKGQFVIGFNISRLWNF